MCPLHGGDIIEKVDVLEWKVHFYAKTAQGPFIEPERSDISVIEDSQIVCTLNPPTSARTAMKHWEVVLSILKFFSVHFKALQRLTNIAVTLITHTFAMFYCFINFYCVLYSVP